MKANKNCGVIRMEVKDNDLPKYLLNILINLDWFIISINVNYYIIFDIFNNDTLMGNTGAGGV